MGLLCFAMWENFAIAGGSERDSLSHHGLTCGVRGVCVNVCLFAMEICAQVRICWKWMQMQMCVLVSVRYLSLPACCFVSHMWLAYVYVFLFQYVCAWVSVSVLG